MFVKLFKGGSITINGVSYSGSNVIIDGDKIIVDGKAVSTEPQKNIEVVVHGDVESLKLSSGSVKANTIGDVSTQSGDVECAEIRGDVKTMSGDVHAQCIGGNVKTMSGDIRGFR